jgi:hypothetical protein
MSGQGTRYVWERLLEPGLGTGHVRCWDLTRVKTGRSDMSDLGTEYVQEMLLEPSDPARYVRQKDFATVKIVLIGYV